MQHSTPRKGQEHDEFRLVVNHIYLVCEGPVSQLITRLTLSPYYDRLSLSVLVNTSKKETVHYFKGQQLETLLLYRFVIYIGLLEKFLALI